jgi:hypothetical protein
MNILDYEFRRDVGTAFREFCSSPDASDGWCACLGYIIDLSIEQGRLSMTEAWRNDSARVILLASMLSSTMPGRPGFHHKLSCLLQSTNKISIRQQSGSLTISAPR